MAKSNSERQREFKARKAEHFIRLDVLLPINEAKLLSSQAKEARLSKADYITKLLHGKILVRIESWL